MIFSSGKSLGIPAIALTLLLSLPASAAVVRYTQLLDGGVPVTVDNASGWSQTEVWNIVLAADRSTREECVYDPPDIKGLFKTGDRIFVNQNYLAWFDFTVGDGVTFPSPPYANNWPRSGELAGFWTLDPSTHLFKHYRTGPNGCSNWPANELIPGSASPNGGTNWWDAYAPPIEHTLSLTTTATGANMFMSFHYAQSTANSGFQVLLDGYDGVDGVHYKQQAKMTSSNHNVDISDNNDGSLSGQYIDADIEYICRSGDVLCTWKFKPNVTVTAHDIYSYIWSSYSGNDLDGTGCDPYTVGSQYPSSTEVTKQPMYASARDGLQNNWNFNIVGDSVWMPMVMRPPCPPAGDPDPYNDDMWSANPGLGSWIRWGVDDFLDSTNPRFQLINLATPNTGSGTLLDPISMPLGSLLFSHERHDETLGVGIGLAPSYTLVANQWYQIYYSFSTSF
ncbi:MAG TPA: hypothetical protein VGQ65_03980 [Thermoanaerobaculia bacterium]|jgi:hypothetical protein|nr:hypothetical protein [Thermoanaerobaculia bacterium]